MPTAFKRYAVDFDGDGRRDVVGSVPDVIASTANHLKKAGWVAGQTWGYEVVVPQGFNFMLADPARKLTMPEWARHGVQRARRGEPFPRPADKAYLFVPAGARGPCFLMLDNFRAIMKYNPAEAYALAIGHLADRLRGGGADRAGLAARGAGAHAAPSGSNCSSTSTATASTSASRTAGSATRPASRCAISRREAAWCRTALPRRRFWSGCGPDN